MDKKLKFYRSRLSKLLLALITVLITIGAIELGIKLTTDHDKFSVTDNIRSLQTLKNPVGYKLREKAWRSSFSERGLGIPPGGPREGLRGEGITPVNCAVAECNFRKYIPGLIEVDANGFQRVGKLEKPYPSILIIGGSVAWGAGASDIRNTYFSRLYDMLKDEYPDTGISVLAAYASTSGTDLSYFVNKGLDAKPDIVVFLNGLNDITVKGSLRPSDASDYILNMKIAERLAERNGITTVIVRQPFPGGKKDKTGLEEEIMELSNKDYEEVITPLYNHIGKALEKMAKTGEIYYIDAADCFENETATTFNDQWHFSDPGHQLLAEKIYSGLIPVLQKLHEKKELQPK